MSAATVKGSQRNLFWHRNRRFCRLDGLRAARRGRASSSRRLLTAFALLSIQVHGRARHTLNRTDIIRHWINPYFEPRLTAPPAFFAILYCSWPSPRFKPTLSTSLLDDPLVARGSLLPDLDFILASKPSRVAPPRALLPQRRLLNVLPRLTARRKQI